MFDLEDERLRAWADAALRRHGETVDAISLDLPPHPREDVVLQPAGPAAADASATGAAPDADQSCVSLYLLELADSPPPRTMQRPPLQVIVCYLVTAWAHSPARSHALLGTLLYAAMDEPGMEVDLTPPSAQMWLALGVQPRPGFVLRVLVRRARETVQAPLVRQPLQVRTAAAATLWGVVHGPGHEPLAGARVMLPALRTATVTDARGRFHIGLVPGSTTVQLQISARGHQRDFSVEGTTSPEEPVFIFFSEVGEGAVSTAL